MTLNELAKMQHDWVEEMGWHNKTPLECLALVGSEVGEAVNECRGESPTEKLGEELADIILRTLDFAHAQRIDIDAQVIRKMDINRTNGTKGRVK